MMILVPPKEFNGRHTYRVHTHMYTHTGRVVLSRNRCISRQPSEVDEWVR